LKLLKLLSASYYRVVLMVICTLAALVVSIVHYRRHRRLRIFMYYIAFSLLQDLIAIIGILYTPGDSRPTGLPVVLEFVSLYGFTFFEFIVYNLFILHYINSPIWRRILRINAWIFFALILLGVSGTFKFLNHTYPVFEFLLESISLVPPCLIYFYQLFQTDDPQPLKDQPSFWVITGLLFLKACSIPLLLTVQLMLGYESQVFTLNYILYSLSFVLLIRAFLCPPSNAQPLTRGNSTPVSG
jgi:hypothetical protein